MDVLIFSDDRSAADRLRESLAGCGIDCLEDAVRPVDSARSVLDRGAGSTDVVFQVLSDDETSLTLLSELCSRPLLRVVAVGAARDPQFMMRVIHAGPADYLDIDGDLTEDLERALSRLRDTAPERVGGGRLISVFSHCGGSGCSLLAANLAVALADKHKECLLCDFNVRRGDLATMLDLKPRFSVNDVSRNHTKLQRDVFEQALTVHPSGVHLLAAPSSFSEVRPIPTEAVSQIIELAQATFPFAVADLEDFFHPEQFEILRQSSRILFVLRMDYTALRNARRTFEYLERAGVNGERISLVVNQFGRPRELTTAQAEEVLGHPLSYFIPYDPKVAIASVNRGEPVLRAAPRSRLSKSVRKIAKDVSKLEVAVASN
jgi:pilus assembly protein CpaE